MTKVISTRETTGRRRVVTMNEDPSLTVQSDRHLAEMKEILRAHKVVGIEEHLREVDLQFRDVSEFTDFADLAMQAKVAEGEFMKLPSKIREVFHHDHVRWLDAAHDPEKLEALRPQLEQLGVMDPLPVPPAPPAPPAAPAPVPPTPPSPEG